MKTILVIGASGFIGQHLVSHLKDYKIITSTREDFDLTELSKMKKFIEKCKPHIVVNLAADKSRGATFSDYRKMIEVNLLGTLNIAEATSSFPAIEHLVFLGSAEEYGDGSAPFKEDQTECPISAYTFSKTSSRYLLEALKVSNKTAFTFLRPTLVYGPGQGNEMFLPALIASLKQKIKFPLTKGEQVRDYVHVSDVCSAVVNVIEKPVITNGQVYNVGSGDVKSIKELAELVANKLGAQDLLEIGKLPYRDGEIFDYRISTAKIEKDLGWKAQISIEKGLSELLS